MKLQTAVLLMTALLGSNAEAKTIRATDLKASDWSSLSQSSEEIVLEFRQGDEIPLSVKAGGDLIEIRQPTVNLVSIKRDFWIRIQDNTFQLSLDARNYAPLKESLSGSLTLDTDSSGAFAVGLDTFLK